MSRIILAIIALSLIPALTACGKKDAEQPGTKAAVKKQAVVQAQAPAAAPAPAGSAAEVKFRNPFQSHLVISRGLETGQKARGPLECCDLSTFKLLAIVVGSDGEGFGLLQAQDGKRYIVRRGDTIGAMEGKVVKLTSKAVVVREVQRDDEGKIKSSDDIELRLPEKPKQ
ncbi:MAG TPA: pilus assembly protein PilP [Thermodesulfobacteriota bacterium]